MYANGFIEGQGTCKRYSPATSSGISAVVLTGTDVPRGKATSASGASVCLLPAPNTCADFADSKAKAIADGMPIAEADFAVNKLCGITDGNVRIALNKHLDTARHVKQFFEQIVGNGVELPRHISNNINDNFGVLQLKAWKKLHTSGFETDFEYIRTLSYNGRIPYGSGLGIRVDITTYDVTVLGTKNVIISSGVSGQGGKIWATFNNNIITATGGEGGAIPKRNNLLNVPELIRGAEYKVSGPRNASGRADYVTYNIDNQGRVMRISASLVGVTTGNRDTPLQGSANSTVRDGRGAPADNGGHMIGAQFDGPVELINYFAQAASMNQPQPRNHPANLPPIGLWAAMEDEWAATLPTQTVEVIIEPQFTAGSNNKRPERFNVRYSYGGVPQNTSNNNNFISPIPNQP